MKQSLTALQKHENQNDSLILLYNYIATKDSNLIKLYCRGKMHLPSFILLKQLHNKFSELTEHDRELEMLFINAIKCSKLFYLQTINTVKKTNNSEQNFEHLFSKQLKPLGQRLVNLLISIKYRIRIVRARRLFTKKEKLPHLLNVCHDILKTTIHTLHEYVYKIKLMQSNYNFFSRTIYYGIALLTLIGLWLLNSSLIYEFSTTTLIIFNIIITLIIATLARLSSTAPHFEFINIDGKNLVAYKYQIFFNNISNKKMYEIFTLQDNDDTRQN